MLLFAVADLEQYRNSEQERERTQDLLRLIPRGLSSVLDIGAREGYFSRLLTGYFDTVTALDLQEPAFAYPNVTTVAGNVTNLSFPDSSFDCVFCCEVLEHVPDLRKACTEIARVTRHYAIVGVPFRQDIRLFRTTCRSCGKADPPWGHVNSFSAERLASLFLDMRVMTTSFVGTNNQATNALSVLLMDLAGNPYGTYGQDELCIHCGEALLSPPADIRLWQKLCSGLGERLRLLQRVWQKPHGNWIHVVFEKRT